MKSKILIIGASGLLGSYLMDLLTSDKLIKDPYLINPIDYEVIGTKYKSEQNNLLKLNIHDLEDTKLLIKAILPKTIILCSANTIVDDYENDKNLYKKETKAVKNIASICKELSIKLCYISSDYVFKNGLHKSDDIPNPINTYGKCKLVCEHIVLSSAHKNLILRLSSLYGYSKTSSTVRLLNNISINKEFNCNKIDITPTHASNAAYCVASLLDSNGIYHFSDNSNFISKFDFMTKILNKYNQKESGSFNSLKLVDFKPTAERPSRSGLESNFPDIVVNTGLMIKLFLQEYYEGNRASRWIRD